MMSSEQIISWFSSFSKSKIVYSVLSMMLNITRLSGLHGLTLNIDYRIFTSLLLYLYSLPMLLTLWRPLLPYGYSHEASCARPGYAIICNFWHPGTLTLNPERQSARMSKITSDGLIRSGTGCFIAVPMWHQWASKG